MDQVELEAFIELFANFDSTNDRETAKRALSSTLERQGFDDVPAVVEEVVREHDSRMGVLIDAGGVSADLESWYLPRPDVQRPRWVHARSRIGLDPDAVEVVDKTTDEILAKISNPRDRAIRTRGLVLGYVQSGKTTNFLSLAAKAADEGYDLIIILAGIHNSLRRQTQERAESVLFHNRDLWWSDTTVGDFKDPQNPLGSCLAGNGKRGLLVVKKNKVVLEELADWLEGASHGTKASTSILVIDDEADQAGLDVAKGTALEGVHREVMRIVNLTDDDGNPRSAYVAYTATPYANVLTRPDEDNLYPRDFIYPLPKPPRHIGPPELFGDEVVGSPIHLVHGAPEDDDTEAVHLSDDMKSAVRWFVLATSARAAIKDDVGSFHSTMLIHTSRLVNDQQVLQPEIHEYVTTLHESVVEDGGMLASLEQEYLKELGKVSASTCGENAAAWSDVSDHLPEVLRILATSEAAAEPFREDGKLQQARSGVLVDNGYEPSEDRLTYSKVDDGEPGVIVIVIGGDTLSRGLTLEGLTVSFFARDGSNYDTLMQMGRWFGFRPGYRHLTRIWTTPGLRNKFETLTEVEDHFRGVLDWMAKEKLTPARYGPEILKSPGMKVTRPQVVKAAKVEASYAGYTASTTRLKIDEDSCEQNIAAARKLIAAIEDPWREIDDGPSKVAEGVPARHVKKLLSSYQFHPKDHRMDPHQMKAYIDRSDTNLDRWTVAVVSAGDGSERGTLNLGGNVGNVPTITRSKVDDGLADGAYIKTLMSPGDDRIDLEDKQPAKRLKHEPPLLCIYCIDAKSEPQHEPKSDRKGPPRVALDADDTVIGLAFVFPLGNERDFIRPIRGQSG